MRMRHGMVGLAVVAAATTQAATAAHTASYPTVTVLNATALGGYGTGSAVGPDHALYVPNAIEGTLVRVDPATGAATVVGTGLPERVIPIGGAMDVAFAHGRAFALVSIAGADVGVPDAKMGLYRLDDDGKFDLFADIGTWAAANPPADPDSFIPQGVQYSVDAGRDGFVVSDAHHGRLIAVDRHGAVSSFHEFPTTDSVPTGLTVARGRAYVATAGPIPHLPSTSRILELREGREPSLVAAWGPGYAGHSGLIVGVAPGPGNRLFGLLQGFWDLPDDPSNEGFPAAPDTGEIVEVDAGGAFRTIVAGLNQPTSFEIINYAAFVVTLDGTILRVDSV